MAALASVPAAAAPVDDEAPDPSARRAAYEALSAWFNDWATTPRTAFDARELVPRPQ